MVGVLFTLYGVLITVTIGAYILAIIKKDANIMSFKEFILIISILFLTGCMLFIANA